MTATSKFALPGLLGIVISFGAIDTATAQPSGLALEEIIVTAQRREQALQEVPISIEAITGIEIQQQGYRDLNELANFSPSVYIDESGFLSQDRSIRGFGTFGNALTLEQAVPIFVDGIHFGRPAQVKLAFLDPARVEILKGPQPVFFGMNASAGAFNITSAGPTPEWEGYVDSEFGNNATAVLNAAMGGPLTDTLGIRVAAKYESADGFLDDVVTGQDHGGYENIGGRLILKYSPRENLDITFKAEYSDIDKDNEAVSICRTAGPLVYGRDDPTNDPGEGPGNERSIWAEPDIDPVTGLNNGGVGWSVPYVPLDFDCYGDKAVSPSGPFYPPPDNIREENSNFGAIDVRAAADELIKRIGVSDGLNDTNEQIESSNGYLSFNYVFGGGIEAEWKTGWSTMDRANSRDNSNSPFLLNYQNRGQDYDQYSTELRFTSAPGGHDIGGGNSIEWMAGYLWQKTDLDIISNSPRTNVRRGLRLNNAAEEQEWNTIFATVTFNFMDGKASVDLGGRYADLTKLGWMSGIGSQWVFDVTPCDWDEDYTDPNCALHGRAVQITAADTEFLLPGADTSNLWAITAWQRERRAPSSWIGGRASAVGMLTFTPDGRLAREAREGFYTPENGGNFSTSETSPQVTLRYRPTENHSLFLRYAESFKAGGFDTGVTSIPSSVDAFRFESESSDTIELGSKGTLSDGRTRYDIALFQTTFNDLQVASDTGNVDDPFVNINAGEQQVKGVEFSVSTAVTENLTFTVAGAIMDGEMTDFPNAGCTEAELINADVGPCISAAEAADIGIPDKEGTIDRSGTQSPKTPDWKFVFGVDYEVPVWSGFVLDFNAKGYVSDGFITDASGFSLVTKMNEHEDLNLTVGIGPQEGTWRVSVYGRNLLEPRVEYNPQYDIFPDGIASASLSRSDFRSYGLKFRYNFQ